MFIRFQRNLTEINIWRLELILKVIKKLKYAYYFKICITFDPLLGQRISMPTAKLQSGAKRVPIQSDLYHGIVEGA